MNKLLLGMVFAAMIFSISLVSFAQDAPPAEEAGESPVISTYEATKDRSVGMVDFFVHARFPLNALEKTVYPIGDDIFAAERKGLQRTLRRLMYGIIKSSTQYNLVKLQNPESLGDAVDKSFLYYMAPETPSAYFRADTLAELAATLGADLIFAGVVEDLTFENFATPKESVSLKIGFVLFDASEQTFLYSKSFSKKTGEVTGFPDKSLLPRIQGRIPDDINYFSESDTGRVFMAIAEDFLNDFIGGQVTPYLGSTFQGIDFEEEIEENSKAPMPDRTGDADMEPTTASALCTDIGQAVVLSVPGTKEGFRVYPCRNGFYDFTNPETQTDRFISSSKGMSSFSRGDFDGDGTDELVVGTHEPGEKIRIYKLKNGVIDIDNYLDEASGLFSGLETGVYAATGDFDGDGLAEIAVSPDQISDEVKIFDFRDGELYTFSPAISFTKNFIPSGFGAMPAAGDFNGDGKDELIISTVGGGEQVKIFELPTGPRMRPKLIGDLAGFLGNVTNSVSVAAGDFDGDGNDELALSSLDNGVQVIVVDYQDGKFRTDAPIGFLKMNIRGKKAGARVFAGDFDGDGKDELVVSVLGSEGELSVFKYSNGKFQLSDPLLSVSDLYEYSYNGVIFSVGKFN